MNGEGSINPNNFLNSDSMTVDVNSQTFFDYLSFKYDLK